jgi:hypothetical protein
MKFVLVNARTPCRRLSCVLCGETIGTGYLREIATGLFYCDHDCYADHCRSAVQAIANHARAWLAAPLPSRAKERSEAER